MKKLYLTTLAALTATTFVPSVSADDFINAVKGGKPYLDLRLRYESVEQDNIREDANALTLRTRLGYNTGNFHGFSATLEAEDSRIVLAQDEFSTPNGFNGNEFSVVADPETTEIDQGYIAYKNDWVSAKLGRQVLTYDNHRFVGHVGWRQDRQTFDGISFDFSPVQDLSIKTAFLEQRNRILAEDADQNSSDFLFNASYKTSIGKLTGYYYSLEQDEQESIDTVGVSLKGKVGSDIPFIYAIELASQSNDNNDADTNYTLLEVGTKISGVTAKLGYEVLGSDDGAAGFTTPLATLHKFNGWADLFLATPDVGLVDAYVSVGGKVSGVKLLAVYHDFSADESNATVDDLGSEINLLAAKSFGKHYSAGVKYASYSAGDDAAGKVDTDKLWIWGGLKF